MSDEGRQYALQIIRDALEDEGFRRDWNNLSEEEKEIGLLYYEQVYDGMKKYENKKGAL